MIIKWHKCYDEGWKGIITPESFQHPAKMAYGLLKRILAHAEEQGWLTSQSIILDCFGGIATTGLLAAYRGYHCVMVELEAKFVDLAEQNFKLHDNAWSKLGCPRPIILQGDSRQLCQIVEKADCIVSSPPFTGESQGVPSGVGSGGPIKRAEQKAAGFSEALGGYGQTPGQLGAMKPGKVDAIISSPPYAESLNSPKDGIDISKIKYGNKETRASRAYREGLNYGTNPGNLGNQQGNTFWAAAKTILEQCFQILKPGGHAIWVVKSFVRKGKIVDFPGDWRRLCESVGFKTVCVHHAMLKKVVKNPCLFGGDIVKVTKRVSFFRRLAESKGSPPIDWETVLCTKKASE